MIRNPGPNIKLHLHGSTRAHFALRVVAINGGAVSLATVKPGSINTGHTVLIPVDAIAPLTRITSPRTGSRVRRPVTVTGTATDTSGVGSVSFALQDTRTGRWYNPRSRTFKALHPVALAAHLGRTSRSSATWAATLPAALRVGRTYLLIAAAVDRAGNHQLTFKSGLNIVRFTIRR